MRWRCDAEGAAFFYKQSAAPRTEMGIELDGQIVRAYPTPRGSVAAGLFDVHHGGWNVYPNPWTTLGSQ